MSDAVACQTQLSLKESGVMSQADLDRQRTASISEIHVKETRHPETIYYRYTCIDIHGDQHIETLYETRLNLFQQLHL